MCVCVLRFAVCFVGQVNRGWSGPTLVRLLVADSPNDQQLLSHKRTEDRRGQTPSCKCREAFEWLVCWKLERTKQFVSYFLLLFIGKLLILLIFSVREIATMWRFPILASIALFFCWLKWSIMDERRVWYESRATLFQSLGEKITVTLMWNCTLLHSIHLSLQLVQDEICLWLKTAAIQQFFFVQKQRE